MIEDFQFKYEDKDIELFWAQKQWPLEIFSDITDGNYMVQNKASIFTARLDQEKDNFVKSIEQFK